jgi:hypothetical protein
MDFEDKVLILDRGYITPEGSDHTVVSGLLFKKEACREGQGHQ